MDRKDLSSTEIYIYDHNDGSEWSYAASLPSGRNKPAAVTLDNSVLLFGEFIFWINYINNNLCINVFKGGTNGTRQEDILRYNGATDKWLNVGKMKNPRSFVALLIYE